MDNFLKNLEVCYKTIYPRLDKYRAINQQDNPNSKGRSKQFYSDVKKSFFNKLYKHDDEVKKTIKTLNCEELKYEDFFFEVLARKEVSELLCKLNVGRDVDTILDQIPDKYNFLVISRIIDLTDEFDTIEDIASFLLDEMDLNTTPDSFLEDIDSELLLQKIGNLEGYFGHDYEQNDEGGYDSYPYWSHGEEGSGYECLEDWVLENASHKEIVSAFISDNSSYLFGYDGLSFYTSKDLIDVLKWLDKANPHSGEFKNKLLKGFLENIFELSVSSYQTFYLTKRQTFYLTKRQTFYLSKQQVSEILNDMIDGNYTKPLKIKDEYS